VGLTTRLSSKVTAAVRANNLPLTVVPVVAVIDASARIVPLNTVPVPRVAELPTCQKMLHALAPLISLTTALDDVVSVDESIWKALIAPFRPLARRPGRVASAERHAPKRSLTHGPGEALLGPYISTAGRA
jgi:hypothetical protein